MVKATLMKLRIKFFIQDFIWESMVSKVLQKTWIDHNQYYKIDHKVTYFLKPKLLFKNQKIKELDILMIKNKFNKV